MRCSRVGPRSWFGHLVPAIAFVVLGLTSACDGIVESASGDGGEDAAADGIDAGRPRDDAGAADDDAGTDDDADVVAPPVTFRNPVRGGAADPFLFFHEGNYYLTYTTVDHIEVVRSPSLAGLATAAPTTIWRDATPSRCCNMWAPELHRFGDRWYVHYTADDGNIANHRQYVLESEGPDPLGPYAFKAQLATPSFFAIDGTVAQFDDTWYFVWSGVPIGSSSQNLYIAALLDPWTIGPSTLLSSPYLPWEIHGNDGTTRRVNEGPIALYHDGRTTIVFSASGCETPFYALGTLELTGGGGPLDIDSWEKSDDPVFAQNAENGVYGPGHNSFFTSPDGSEIWNAYHATDQPAGTCGGSRSLRVQRMSFEGGRPIFGVPVALGAELQAPSGGPGP